MIQLTYGEKDITINTTEETYMLENLSPATRVDFIVSAVSICGAVGEQSTTSEITDAIRKSMYIILLTILLKLPNN